MTLSRSEHSAPYRPAVPRPGPHLVLAAAVATTAAAGGLLVHLVPPALLLPALSLLSFWAAGIVALLAYLSGADRHAGGMTLWDLAGVLAVIWFATGILSSPEQVVQLFGHLLTAQ
jgi:hypothetical protein